MWSATKYYSLYQVSAGQAHPHDVLSICLVCSSYSDFQRLAKHSSAALPCKQLLTKR